MPLQQVTLQVMTVIQIHATVTAVAVVADAVVVAHKVKVLMVPREIHRKIPQKVQKMELPAILQTELHIAAAVVVAPPEKMSLQEKQLMKMA
jgi:lysylphosphatidylglycerol synthetase-like protein (DUF2156 family)